MKGLLDSRYMEAYVMSKYREYLIAKGVVEDDVEKAVRAFDFRLANHPLNAGAVDVAEPDVPVAALPASSSATDDQVFMSSVPGVVEVPMPVNSIAGYSGAQELGVTTKYWVSISSKSGFKRLHRTGACWYRSSQLEGRDRIEGIASRAYCVRCFKEQAARPDEKVESDASITTEEESSSTAEDQRARSPVDPDKPTRQV